MPPALRFIGTKRFLRKIITSHGKGSGSGTSANIAILTNSAFAFEQVKIPQFQKDRMSAIRFLQRSFPYVSARQGQKPARVDVTAATHEKVPVTGIDTFWGQADTLSRPEIATHVPREGPFLTLSSRVL